jgi:predicted AlkP superfamily pyrophosphatase or phosphodiesterase
MKLYIFLLDALSAAYFERGYLPALTNLFNHGIRGQMRVGAMFEGIVGTVFTGKPPSETGVWTRFFYDPQNSPFKYQNLFGKQKGRIADRYETKFHPIIFRIWRKLARSLGYESVRLALPPVPYEWAERYNISIPHYKNIADLMVLNGYSTIFRMLKEQNWRSYEFYGYWPQVEHALLSTSLKDPAIAYIHTLLELDEFGHKYGPFANETTDLLSKLDKSIARLFTTLLSRQGTRIVFFADHGMMDVQHELNTADFLAEVGKNKGLTPFVDSTMIRLIGGGKELLEDLSKEVNRPILDRADLQDRNLQNSTGTYADFALFLPPGWVAKPDFWSLGKNLKGMHGYAESPPELMASWGIIDGDGVNQCFVQDPIELSSLASIIWWASGNDSPWINGGPGPFWLH